MSSNLSGTIITIKRNVIGYIGDELKSGGEFLFFNGESYDMTGIIEKREDRSFALGTDYIGKICYWLRIDLDISKYYSIFKKGKEITSIPIEENTDEW